MIIFAECLPDFPLFLANMAGSISVSFFPLVEKSLFALSSRVPPHLSPRAIRADLSLSRPSDASSSGDEKAERSR